MRCTRHESDRDLGYRPWLSVRYGSCQNTYVRLVDSDKRPECLGHVIILQPFVFSLFLELEIARVGEGSMGRLSDGPGEGLVVDCQLR